MLSTSLAEVMGDGEWGMGNGIWDMRVFEWGDGMGWDGMGYD